MLSSDDFHLSGRLTQYVSIDLVVHHNHKYLLGLRNNKPAKGTYFVPGSKTYKGKHLSDDFKRITNYELGKEIGVDRMDFIGVFDHIYDCNFRDDSYGTHYVCNTVMLKCLNDEEAKLFEETVSKGQHSNAVWMSRAELLESEQVHQFTKNYFLDRADNVFWRKGYIG